MNIIERSFIHLFNIINRYISVYVNKRINTYILAVSNIKLIATINKKLFKSEEDICKNIKQNKAFKNKKAI